MKNVLFLSSWYPSRVHNTLGNFVKYHALASSKYNSINVLYIVADDKVKNYEIDYFKDHEIATTIVYFKRGIFKEKSQSFTINKRAKSRCSINV